MHNLDLQRSFERVPEQIPSAERLYELLREPNRHVYESGFMPREIPPDRSEWERQDLPHNISKYAKLWIATDPAQPERQVFVKDYGEQAREGRQFMTAADNLRPVEQLISFDRQLRAAGVNLPGARYGQVRIGETLGQEYGLRVIQENLPGVTLHELWRHALEQGDRHVQAKHRRCDAEACAARCIF